MGENRAAVPYTCGYVSANGKEVFLVATLHISPRAPRDVEAVIATTMPDVAMIELDEERLDRMRDVEVERPSEPDVRDLQPIRITVPGQASSETVLAQRALWNAERAGETISGDVIYDSSSQPSTDIAGHICVVNRKGPDGECAPWSLTA